MSQIAEQKCPACGAPQRFDPASGKLVCDYCGTVTDVQADTGKMKKKPGGAAPAKKPEKAGKGASAGGTVPSESAASGTASSGPAPSGAAAAGSSPAREEKPAQDGESEGDRLEGFDFANLKNVHAFPGAETLPVYSCVSCGASVIAPPEQVALTCPYCRNNIVLTDKVSGSLRPDGVIPFTIQAKDLPDAVNRFYRNKKLLPPRFFSESTMGKVTGVYVPFWVFNGRISGEVNFNAQTSATSRSGDYRITTTSYYRLAREAAMDFKNIPVDASQKVDNCLMDSLEPFYADKTVPFDMRYLAGFTADRFDDKRQDIEHRAKKRMLSTAQSIVSSRAVKGYMNVTPHSSSLHANLDAQYILYPVYMFDIEHAGKKYHFAVNGQTGKVVGEIPTDSGVSFLYFLKRFAIVSGGLIAFSVAKYMLGM